MLNAVYILNCKGPDRRNITEVLELVTSRTKYVPGCFESGVWSNEERSELMLFEIWRSKEDFERHVNSNLYKRLLEALEMSSEKPVVKISECVNVRGIEAIEEVMENNKI